MSLPHGPFLELSFFLSDREDPEAFASLVEALVGLGATFTGPASVWFAPDVRRTARFEGVDEDEFTTIHVGDGELERLLLDPNALVGEVEMTDASGLGATTAEVVTYLLISARASREGDHHPVAIWADGRIFEFPEDAPASLEPVYWSTDASSLL